MQLEELTLPLGRVRGVGPAYQKALHAMGIRCVRDLLWHLPREYQDRASPHPLANALRAKPGADAGVWVNAVATVVGHEYFGAPPRQTLKVLIEEDGVRAALVCFGRNFLANQLRVGLRLAVAGQAQLRYGEIQLAVFDFAAVGPDGSVPADFSRLLPVYPLSGDLTQGFFRKSIAVALQAYGQPIAEMLPPAILARRGWPERAKALADIHAPPDRAALALARDRLVYEELLLLQLQVGDRVRRRRGTAPQPPAGAPAPEWPAPLVELRRSLPFELTDGQRQAVDEIVADLNRPWPMARLIQGDVGSGKTLVALMAALAVIARGGQAALMVPTVLLARQHAEKASALLAPLGIRIALLAGPMPAGGRKALQAALAAGEVDLAIGTHALFSEQVSYRRLDLAIVDEQHRFGVLQRQALHDKTQQANILLMSATPIPQTLVLTAFGDLDVSVIRELPAQRLPIETHLARMGNEGKVYDWVERELAAGRQAYFVYPLIDEGSAEPEGGAADEREGAALKDAESMYRHLAERVFPRRRLGMVHSKMEDEAKASVMEQFAAGELDILVATSVVEVGVDIPNASCMVIEHAERFGLAALHQLRGRVGRGPHQSYCFLVYADPLGEVGKQRLKVIKESRDGFRIAEEDLAIRGPGDIKGTAQSGFVRLRIADLLRDADSLRQANADARSILDADPELSLPEHRGLRRVLDLLQKEEAP